MISNEVIPWSDVEYMVKTIALRHLPKDPMWDADDLTQETMIAMWRQCPCPNGWNRGKGIIWYIARNTQIMAMRRSHTLAREGQSSQYDKAMVQIGTYDREDPISLDQFVQQRATLIKILRETLTARQAKVLWRQLQGYTYDEIAEALGITRDSIRQLTDRAKVRIAHEEYVETPICDKCGLTLVAKWGKPSCVNCGYRVGSGDIR